MTPAACRTTEPTTDDGLQDTIALLQEEIARLEAEIRLRDEADDASRAFDEPAAPANEADELRAAELTAELAQRDETIALLWEHIQQFEAAEAVSRAEWEQLASWVDEVERRVEGVQDLGALQDDLAAERRGAEEARREVEAERRAWTARLRRLEEEIGTLQAKLLGATSPEHAGEARALLERENQALRDECRRLAAFESQAAELDPLREKLQSARAEVEAARRESRQHADELHRVRMECEIELTAARGRAAREEAESADQEPSPDERIRALRQHLREIHEREEQDRKGRQLSTRLSRLWRRTGPVR